VVSHPGPSRPDFALLGSPGLAGGSEQDFVQCHSAGSDEGDDVGDVVGGDGELFVELFGALFGGRVGDVVGEFGGNGAGFGRSPIRSAS
jgi:hypothetical protein